MSRKGSAPKRKSQADAKYKDKLVAKFINKLMWDGKKTAAEKIVYGAFAKMESAKNDDALKLFKQAIENVKPLLEVRSRRVGGANYQVPVEVRTERKVSLAFRWIIDYARSRGEKTMSDRLANELMEALENRGGAIKKKEDVHRMAEANRAFAHYRW
ncbi:MAG: 30S ribosomal protein S7 [Deltaproteobacteria bacterium RIFCSPLOWO2_12_FULL_40_28]|nr:MAG: 30S ribosomal protein S7 [Deltaproteobacteria bacterium RIFCSPHIGHO2_02_FULL_40_28]OGQ19367.1 MAG: 30S ribosomal protein S7 [Deltaproteobacteria bacterium RIFCSPHIGHO2_12_FULL_40_32]OGQ39581.1 MAG: 30S ribosomal protein S7 [Deltaproteobacteria bacterium RIFCSPLOWO2_02_FULL_40_36]OGQ53817.1 MAG: 30S ribosomal protein S7 [Deltaproteobacteria bacterium RIFCSPLOWO2_12_FULL_40_28]